MARWNRWECRLGRPGMARPARHSPKSGGAPGTTRAITPCSISSPHVARPAAAGQPRFLEPESHPHRRLTKRWTAPRPSCYVRCVARRQRRLMPYDTLWRNLRLATMAEGAAPVLRGAVAAEGGRIAFAGPESELPARDARRVVDCGGRWATPGLVDCHTHLVFGGDRAAEFAMRLAGATYEEIARARGRHPLHRARHPRRRRGLRCVACALRRLDAPARRGRHHGRGEVRLRARPRNGSAVPACRAPPRARAPGGGPDHLPRRPRPAARGRGRQGRLHRPRLRGDAAGPRR